MIDYENWHEGMIYDHYYDSDIDAEDDEYIGTMESIPYDPIEEEARAFFALCEGIGGKS